MNPYPPADDPTSADPAGMPPLYVDPVTGQQLFVDPITGALNYAAQAPTSGAAIPEGVTPGAVPPGAGYPLPYGPPAYPSYGYPAYGGFPAYAYPGVRATNGLAVGSMVTSIVGAMSFWCYGVGGILGLVGAILGHVALRQIRARDDAGRGMAIAGVVIGWIAVAVTIVLVVLIGWLISQISHNPDFS